LTWWAKNLGYYECTKCWHLHVTQEWLDRVEAEEKQKKAELKVDKSLG
jgi:hypothetical protein